MSTYTSLNFLRTLKLSEATTTFFDAMFGVSSEENAVLVQHGFWHVAYFAHSEIWAGNRSSWIGVRLLPNTPLSEMPVVATSRYGAITISPKLKNLIPNWILYTIIEPGSWESIQSQWSDVENEIKNIHLQLGGDLALFEKFKTYVLDGKNFETPDYLKENSRAFEFLKVDQSIETTQFREFIQKLILNTDLLPEFPNDFGAWNDYARTTVALRAWRLFADEKKTLLEIIKHVWLGFDKSAPFDSDLSTNAEISQFTIARNPIYDLSTVARTVARASRDLEEGTVSEIVSDPLFPAARALASFDHASGYKGVEHMEAAAKLDLDLNDGKRSYEALISASFWSAMNLGFPYKESYQASLLLARKYGWDEMLELLEMNEFDIQNA
jgi:hypothetical protein